jgi:hypothetical protein
MSPSEPEFSVVDYIWEEIHSISGLPQKSCGYAPYLMHVIEAITNYTFVYDHEHKPFHLKNDVVGPSLADLERAQANIGGQEAPDQPTAAAAPSRAARPSHGRGVDVGNNKCKSPLPHLEIIQLLVWVLHESK